MIWLYLLAPVLLMLTGVQLYTWKHRYTGRHRADAGVDIFTPRQDIWHPNCRCVPQPVFDNAAVIRTAEEARQIGLKALEQISAAYEREYVPLNQPPRDIPWGREFVPTGADVIEAERQLSENGHVTLTKDGPDMHICFRLGSCDYVPTGTPPSDRKLPT